MEVPILRYLDILIGVSVVMLLACTVVTAITQFVISVGYSRARHLRDAVKNLVEQIDPALLGADSLYIAQRMLRHTLVSRSNTPLGHLTGQVRNWVRGKLKRWWPEKLPLPRLNPGAVVQREEIILFLLEWAAQDGVLAQQDRLLARADPAVKARLDRLRENIRRALMRAGVADPAATARSIRERIMAQERADPTAPAQIWKMRAVAETAINDLSAKVFAWFDNTMARVSENFALEAKVVTSAVALLLCFAIQLDTLNLIRRLATDEKYRSAVVAMAPAVIKQSEEQSKKKEDVESVKQAREQVTSALRTLNDPELAIVPAYLESGQMDWDSFKKSLSWRKVPGILLSWVLVSLGAPFWFDLLKKLLGFRSLLARKDDEERKQRQEQQQPAPGAGGPAPPSPAVGGTAGIAGGEDERGDLSLTGAAG